MNAKIDCTRCQNFDPEMVDKFQNQIVHCDKGHRVIFRPKLEGYIRNGCIDYFNPNKK